MEAFKGFTNNLTARLGRGEYQFHEGETVEEEYSKTARGGFHCCENPFDCLGYYPLGMGNRYFRVEASGSIDEDDNKRIACTRMTLLEELSIKKLAGYGMMYMVKYPMRDRWEQQGINLQVKKEQACGTGVDTIAIARGKRPMVKGKKGTICGLILESETGKIEAAKLFVIGEGTKANIWYTLTGSRTLEEVTDAEKED